MYDREPSLIRRDDTFLGVCQALGEDFGFHPNLLRIAFGVPLIFAPMAVLTVYVGLGVIVLLSRILAPRPRRKATAQPDGAQAPAVAQVPLDGDQDQYPLPIAA